jgi:Flp pilus assembly protein TadD
MIRRVWPLLLAAALGACSVAQDFSAEHALDMPSPTEKGYAALAKGDNPTAVKWLIVALQEKPDDPSLSLDLAAAYQRLGRYDDARKLYQTVLDTAAGVMPASVDDPKLKDRDLAQVAASDLALCTGCAMPDEALQAYRHFAAGDFAGAAGLLEAAVGAKPEDPYLKLDLAATERRLGKKEVARKQYQAVIEQEKDKEKAKKPVVPPPKTPQPKTLTEFAEADLAALGQ